MTALLLDVGNTHIDAARWRDRDVSGVFDRRRGCWTAPLERLPGEDVPAASGTAEAVPSGIEQLIRTEDAAPIVLVSVVPWLTQALTDRLPGLLVIDHESFGGIEHRMHALDEVGPDRLCNVAAAVAAGLERALVVDAGTATTFDLLLDGVYHGGLIAPGPDLAARALAERAARLEPVPLAACPLEVGRDTTSAMATGCWHAGQAGIAGIVAGLIERYGQLAVVATGGLGPAVAATGWFVDRDWTLRGAAHLAGLTRPVA